METCRRSSKRSRIGNYSSSIDVDVLEEILSKLPVKSLLRFRCVSQEWYALTKNVYFIARHLSCSDPNLYLLLDYTESPAGNGGNENVLCGLSLLHDETKITTLDLSFFNHKSWKCVASVGSSNGLVCFFGKVENGSAKEWEESILVCNPATKQFRYLPIPTPLMRKYGERPLLGFEFMHDIREYKLVSVFSDASDNGGVISFQAQVLTQSTNSWRPKDTTLEFPSSERDCYTDVSITLNGVLYWLAKDTKSHKYYALSFNLRDEVFHVLPLPMLRPPQDLHLEDAPPFLRWKNSLALLLPSPDGCYQELWAMTESGTTRLRAASWTRQFRIKYSSIPSGWIMGVLKDQILFWTRRYNLLLYNPATKKKRKIPKHEAAAKKYYQGENYVQSLLPIQ